MDSNPPPPAAKPARKLSNEITAAIITGVFGLMAVVAGAVIPQLGEAKREPSAADVLTLTAAVPATVEATATLTLTPTTPAHTSTPTIEITAIPTELDARAKNFTFAGSLPEEARIAAIEGYNAAFKLADQMPLIIRDGFDNNDYRWSQIPPTDYGSLTCEFKIDQSAYHLLIQTKEQGGICWVPVPRQIPSNFVASVDLSTTDNPNTQSVILFRYLDEANYYYMIVNAAAKQFTIGQYVDGTGTSLLNWAKDEGLSSDGFNSVSVIGAGQQTTLYLNQQAVAWWVDPLAVPGQIILRVYLETPNAGAELTIDNFLLRGE